MNPVIGGSVEAARRTIKRLSYFSHSLDPKQPFGFCKAAVQRGN
jgi:hypothetical protein